MINVHGPLAVGLSGEDAGTHHRDGSRPRLGYVGDVVAVDPSIVHRLLAEGLVPVIATIGSDRTGQAYTSTPTRSRELSPSRSGPRNLSF